jgi:hypothetical protein
MITVKIEEEEEPFTCPVCRISVSQEDLENEEDNE